MACLHPCPSCGRHVRASEAACPFCDAALERSFASTCTQAAASPRAITRAALLFAGATAIAGCGGKEENSSSSSGGASSSSGASTSSSSSASSGGVSSSSTSSSSGEVALYGPAPVDAGDPGDAAADSGESGSSTGGVPLYGPPPFED